MAKKSKKKNPGGALGWVLGIGAVALAGWGAYALMAGDSKGNGSRKKKGYKNGTYGKGYGEGEAGADYRKSQGPTTCGNCKFAKAKREDYEGTGSGDLYCTFWKTAVRSDYVCNQWQPEES